MRRYGSIPPPCTSPVFTACPCGSNTPAAVCTAEGALLDAPTQVSGKGKNPRIIPVPPGLLDPPPPQITGLNRTWVSADLLARRTFSHPVRFNPYPSIFLAEKTAESPSGLPLGQSAGLFLPPPPPMY